MLSEKNGGERRIRTSEGECQQIYSLPRLATSVSHQMELTMGLEPATTGLQNRSSTN